MADAQGVLERLNRGSLSRSFTPQTDVDWAAHTTDLEFDKLYGAWSLFEGTALAAKLGPEERIAFAKYQQMNLMLLTSVLERFGTHNMAELYDVDPSRPFQEALSHFIKEETYHYMLFGRAIESIQATMGDLPPLPTGRMNRVMRWLLLGLSLLPVRALRLTLTVMLFRFAEEVTMIANQMSHRYVPRRESLVNRVWACHALDEARHLAFDDYVLERHGLGPRWRFLTGALALPMCALASLLVHANELWAARQLGLRVHLWSLPGLARATTSVFKRRVFALMKGVFRGASARQVLGDSYGAEAT